MNSKNVSKLNVPERFTTEFFDRDQIDEALAFVRRGLVDGRQFSATLEKNRWSISLIGDLKSERSPDPEKDVA